MTKLWYYKLNNSDIGECLSMLNSEKFINIYNELDHYMRELLDEDARLSHNHLIETLAKNNNLFKNYKNDLKEFAELRNAIVHNTHFCGNRYGDIIAEPHEAVVKLYEEVLDKIKRPKIAKDLYRRITDNDVLTAKINTSVMEIINHMYNKAYTCVPIIENSKLVGVFSENVLLHLIAKKGVNDFHKLIIDDIMDLIEINNHDGEYFTFCRIKDNIYDIRELFQNNSSKKRLEMVFVTGNGEANEDILGVISAWDLV